eukprot:TRINITY_DN11275_c0_g1_i1.p1 TRINITY_DN11275_c0_g1~~TRINITY_DN11275_c0_g1_i1.p1  ORF type:complete len:334 (+),score=81.51 TRINITY_DN11275_c0_g1_i1:64-1065(+)
MKKKLVETLSFNVLIMGKTGVGKSTLYKLLTNPDQDPEKSTLFSHTIKPLFSHFTFSASNKLTVALNLIDTPGLREKTKDDKAESRNDETLMHIIMQCVEREITTLHALIICISTEQRLTQDDEIAINLILKAFREEGNDNDIPIIICVTRAEDKSETWFKEKILEIRQVPFLKDIPNSRIKFSGYFNHLDKNFSHEKEAEATMEKVLRLRENFLDIFTDRKFIKPVRVENLPFFKMTLGRGHEAINKYIAILKDKKGEEEAKTVVNEIINYGKVFTLQNSFGQFVKLYEALMHSKRVNTFILESLFGKKNKNDLVEDFMKLLTHQENNVDNN